MDTRPCVAVAASGGRDSTALLHCVTRQARALGVEVVALHVHHGLQSQADAWLGQVRAQARRWGAGFAATRLDGCVPRGESVEAWARRERYAALAVMARATGCGLVLLAHHRRDQAETVLLQALRGGGPAGLAAMPDCIDRAGLVWARPWLAQPREAIEAYVRRHRLRWVDDGSNDSPGPARNRLRLQVWPALTAAFPDAEGRAGARRPGARRTPPPCWPRWPRSDLRDVRAARGRAGCRALPGPAAAAPARAAAPLAAADVLPTPVPETLVMRLAAELGTNPGARPRARLRAPPESPAKPDEAAAVARGIRSGGCWPAGPGEVRLYRGALRWLPSARSAVASPSPPVDRPPLMLDLSATGLHPVPLWGGSWRVRRVRTGGVLGERLHQAQLRPRAGGEQFQATPGGVPRSLKKQFQAAAVPAWARGAPLLYAGDGALLCVPGLGIDARQAVPAGQPQLFVEWIPDRLEA
jgi:tRNA(Ile)-lysidine synthase